MKSNVGFRLVSYLFLFVVFCTFMMISPSRAQAGTYQQCGVSKPLPSPSGVINGTCIVHIRLTSDINCTNGNNGIDLEGQGNICSPSGTTTYVIDCQNHSIVGPVTDISTETGPTGINLSEDNTVVISQCDISDFKNGIFINQVTHARVKANSITANYQGINVCNSTLDEVGGNDLSGNLGGNIVNNVPVCP
jgi:hypothetical protein